MGVRRSILVLALLAAPGCAAAGLPAARDPAPAAAGPVRAGLRIADRIHRGFVESVLADSLDRPVSMAIAPDGRVFVCEQGGALRVIGPHGLLARPFVEVATRAEGEEGLLGVAFDPAFARNHWVYVLYTALAPRRHGRIERFTASGDTALAGSRFPVFDLDNDLLRIHVGGAIGFGADSMLYVATGENGEAAFSQSLRWTAGKLLRIRADGTIPEDDPFYDAATGRHRAIWARGLRSPAALAVDRRTGRLFVNDAGAGRWEEVDEGVAGANYGWPELEGPVEREGFRAPVHAYSHEHGCAITGGTFYDADRPSFPREWVGRYFYADRCVGEIRWFDPASPARYTVFGKTLLPGPVDIRVGPDGALYYLVRGTSEPAGGAHRAWGAVVRVSAAGAGGAGDGR